MTTFTTDDRIQAYQVYQANVEPIPFAGWVDINDNIQETLQLLTGTDPENMPKYIILGDGAVYFYRKEEQRYALCEQTPPVQKRIPATESSGGTRNEERS